MILGPEPRLNEVESEHETKSAHQRRSNFQTATTSKQILEKNGGDDETRTRDLCRDSPEKLTLAKRVAEQPRMAKKLERIEMV